MKKIFRFLSLTMLFVLGISIVQTNLFNKKILVNAKTQTINSDNSELKEIEKEKEIMLKSVWDQLEAQNALNFYPMYKKMIEDRFNQSSKSSITRNSLASGTWEYLSKGGSVYYENYLNTGTKVYETFLDEYATNRALNGTMTEDALKIFGDLLASKIFGWPYTIMVSIAHLVDRETDRQIRNGTGRMELMYSTDGHNNAKVKLHWKDSPLVLVYPGAQIGRVY